MTARSRSDRVIIMNAANHCARKKKKIETWIVCGREYGGSDVKNGV